MGSRFSPFGLISSDPSHLLRTHDFYDAAARPSDLFHTAIIAEIKGLIGKKGLSEGPAHCAPVPGDCIRLPVRRSIYLRPFGQFAGPCPPLLVFLCLVEHLQDKLGISDRRTCGVMGQPRATQRRVWKVRGDAEALRAAIVTPAACYGHYGYRRITALLRRDGWEVNHKRVERIWRQERLKVPQKQPNRGRL